MTDHKAELGKPMTSNTHSFNKKEFPLCPSTQCWCYNCGRSVEKSTWCRTGKQYSMEEIIKVTTQLRDTYLSTHPVEQKETIKVLLGEAMSYNSEHSPPSRFPLCPNEKFCWCHDCSLARVGSRTYHKETYANPQHDCYWDQTDYESEASESATKLRQNYIDTNS